MAYLQRPVLQWFLWKTDYGSTISGFHVQINAFLSLSLSLSLMSLVQYAQLW